MKNSCVAASSILLLALFANAEEAVPLPLSSDSSPAVAQENPPLIAQEGAANNAPEKCSSNTAEDYQKNLRIGAYLHPLTLFWGAAYNMFMFNSTFEIPLNLSNSVIIQPAIWLGSSDGYITVFDGIEYEKLVRIGTGVGIRRYVRDRGQGFYLQAIANAYYISAKSISRDEGYQDVTKYDSYLGYPYTSWEEVITTWKKVKGVVADLTFYLGAAHKWQNVGFFYEGGLGLGYDGTHTYQLGSINRLVASFNMGVGIPF